MCIRDRLVFDNSMLEQVHNEITVFESVYTWISKWQERYCWCVCTVSTQMYRIAINFVCPNCLGKDICQNINLITMFTVCDTYYRGVFIYYLVLSICQFQVKLWLHKLVNSLLSSKFSICVLLFSWFVIIDGCCRQKDDFLLSLL